MTNDMAQIGLTMATHQEIYQQPSLWPVTLALVEDAGAAKDLKGKSAVITGAGTSAYAAAAIARAWPNAQSIATTDLLVDSQALPAGTDVLVSIARSGDSPESTAVVAKIQRQFPRIKHVAITCNRSGKLALLDGVQPIVLDPRTNDKGLAMTSSFSNLVLAGISIQNQAAITPAMASICRTVDSLLPRLEEHAQAIAARRPSRAVILASPQLYPLAREASLKILELSGGRCAGIAETFLGLRHGPMSFLTADSLVLSLLSSDPAVRLYELDLLAELRAKRLGYLVGLVPDEIGRAHV